MISKTLGNLSFAVAAGKYERLTQNISCRRAKDNDHISGLLRLSFRHDRFRRNRRNRHGHCSGIFRNETVTAALVKRLILEHMSEDIQIANQFIALPEIIASSCPCQAQRSATI